MKKRLFALCITVVMVCAMFASTAAAVVEVEPRWEGCSCGGRYYQEKVSKTGLKDFSGTNTCPVNSRYNCDEYNVEWYVRVVCNRCGDVTSTGKDWFIEWVHFNH